MWFIKTQKLYDKNVTGHKIAITKMLYYINLLCIIVIAWFYYLFYMCFLLHRFPPRLQYGSVLYFIPHAFLPLDFLPIEVLLHDMRQRHIRLQSHHVLFLCSRLFSLKATHIQIKVVPFHIQKLGIIMFHLKWNNRRMRTFKVSLVTCCLN